MCLIKDEAMSVCPYCAIKLSSVAYTGPLVGRVGTLSDD